MLRKSIPEQERARLLEVARAIVDPVLFQSLGDLAMLGEIEFRRGSIEVELRVPISSYPAEDEIRGSLSAALGAAGAEEVTIHLAVMDGDERAALGSRLREFEDQGVTGAKATSGGQGGHGKARENPFANRRSSTRVLAISSGKGGVGKSSTTVNLAIALARRGHSVGLLDADIYGFSVPRMIGVPYAPIVLGHTIVPPVAHGVRCISMGFFVDEEQAVAWRGPMLHKALEQFLVDVYWGSPEFLIVDMPPGTGDVALSVAEQLPTAELYVVTTPQPAAGRVAQRSGSLAKQLRLPIRGVIENMSWFSTPDGTRYELFGSGGGETMAKAFGVPLLAQVPLNEQLREAGDVGAPVALSDPQGEVAVIFDQLAEKIADLGPARVYRSELSIS